MIRRIVAKPFPPPESPEQAERAEDPKARPPTGRRNQSDGKRRSHCPAETRSHKNDTVRPAPLVDGEPAREAPRCVRKRAGFPSAEQESKGQQRCEAPHQSGGHRKRGPP